MYKKKDRKTAHCINDKSDISDLLLVNFLQKSATTKEKNFNKINNSSIENYYNILSSSNKEINDLNTLDCFIVRLSRFLIELISSSGFKYDNSRFDNNFYEICMNKIIKTELSEEVNGDELLLIYIKQLLYLFKISNIIVNNSGIAEIKIDNDSDLSLFNELFNSFWNKANWGDIFPSDPVAAKELKQNKNFIKDAILANPGRARLDDVVNLFFDMTGYARKNDLFYISFIDFYLISWLNHFGILKYIKNSCNQPVYIELTNIGKKILTMAG